MAAGSGTGERSVLWVPEHAPGAEHLRLRMADDGIVADGMVVARSGGMPCRTHYVLECDGGWRLRRLEMETGGLTSRRLVAHADGRGNWVVNGAGMPELAGCLEPDISVTPFTNTLPIRRLDLQPGDSAEIRVAYVSVPQLTVQPTVQRYTCVSRGSSGATYRYEVPDTGYAATVTVDADGLAVHYPGAFERY